MASQQHTRPDPGASGPPKELKEALIIYVIGGPAVGKGTHCAMLANEFDITHVSVGDLLRVEADKPGARDRTIIHERMCHGLLAPTDIVRGVLESFLVRSVKQGNRNFLVDGFPRSLEQALDFEDRGCKIKAVIHFDSSEETMRSRMKKRAIDGNRIDDTDDIHRTRYQAFIRGSKPIIDYYETRELYKKVNVTWTSPKYTPLFNLLWKNSLWDTNLNHVSLPTSIWC